MLHCILQVKWSIVESAKRKWPLHFSGLFEAKCVSGLTQHSKTDVVIAISCRGIFLLDEPYHVLVGLHYYELVDAIFVRYAPSKPSASAMYQLRADWAGWSAGLVSRHVKCCTREWKRGGALS